MKKMTTNRVLALLLSGKHPKIKKYAGKHVFVAGSDILPLKKGEEAWNDFEKLEKKHGKAPTLIFVPRPDITYILIHRLQGEFPQSPHWGMSRRSRRKSGVAQPRMKNPPASVLGEASIC